MKKNSFKRGRAFYKFLKKNCILYKFVECMEREYYTYGNDRFPPLSVTNYKTYLKDKNFIKLLDNLGAIISSFSWANTREGVEYWNGMNERLMEDSIYKVSLEPITHSVYF